MKILSIESSALAASAAVTDGGMLLAEEFTQNGLTHSATLLPAVSEALKKSGLDIEDIDIIAVTEGPGSFSGLRIGVTTAKTLAYAADKKTVGVSTLAALAANLPYTDAVLCPIMDARRNQVYNALYEWDSLRLLTKREPRAISAEELVKDIKENIDKDIIFVGDGVLRFKDYFKGELGDKAKFAPLHLCAAKASSAAFLAESMADQAKDARELNPIYLRLSQAEREYIEKNGKE